MPSQNPVCSDGIDNDEDGLVDFGSGITNDPGCSGPNDTDEGDDPSVPECRDGVDNDGDGFADYGPGGDAGCTSPDDPDGELGATQCDDGIDNDAGTEPGEGADMDDPDCDSPADNNEFSAPACSDGVDNDGDGLADFGSDPGCTSATDTDEHGPAQCDNGIDDDGVGGTDFPADIGCEDPTDNDESNTPECSNGISDDTDGLVDLQDPGCVGPRDNEEDDNTPSAVVDFSISHRPIDTHPHPQDANRSDISIDKSSIPTYTTLTILASGVSNIELEVLSLHDLGQLGAPIINKDKLRYFFGGIGGNTKTLTGIGSQTTVRFHVEKRDIVDGLYKVIIRGRDLDGVLQEEEELILRVGPADPSYIER